MKIFLVILAAMFAVVPAFAGDSLTLDAPFTLTVPQATGISDWEIITLDNDEKLIKVRYRWRDASGNVIYVGSNGGWQYWACQNTFDGNGDPISTCFKDFVTITTDGRALGPMFRDELWGLMEAEILVGNGGTFE